jgi:hypothetical protein
MAGELLRALCALATVFIPLAVAGVSVAWRSHRARRGTRHVGHILQRRSAPSGRIG